jgi:hypothetical protein
MRTIILIILASIVGILGCQKLGSGHSNTKITEEGDDIVIQSGDNTYVAEIVSDFEEELRIFGINDNDSDGWNPIGYARYIFVAGPYSGDTEECERRDAKNASWINVIVDDKTLVNAIDDLKNEEGRRHATIIGNQVAIKEYYHNDEDHSKSLTRKGKLDPGNAIIISDIYLEDE